MLCINMAQKFDAQFESARYTVIRKPNASQIGDFGLAESTKMDEGLSESMNGVFRS